MIHEVAQIDIKAGFSEEFEAGVRSARRLFLAAKGCHDISLWRSIEDPLRYHLIVAWDTVEDHVITFRQSEGFTLWRELVQHCFASPPQVGHQERIAASLPVTTVTP